MLVVALVETIGNQDASQVVPLHLQPDEIAQLEIVRYTFEQISSAHRIYVALSFTGAPELRVPAITDDSGFMAVTGLFCMHGYSVTQSSAVGFFLEDVTVQLATRIQIGADPHLYVQSNVSDLLIRVEVEYEVQRVGRREKIAVLGQTGWKEARTLQTL